MVTYHISSSRPLPKVFHFFNYVVTGNITEDWEPVHVRTRLGKEGHSTLTSDLTYSESTFGKQNRNHAHLHNG